jgi:hypothetical protein
MAKGGCGYRPSNVVNHVVSQRDVAGQGHSSGKFVMSRGSLVSQMGDLAIACNERGCWSLWVGVLCDAAPESSSTSVSTMGHGTQTSKVGVWTVAEGEHGRWPVGADEPIVFVVDVTTAGHSTSESTGSARSHRFVLNN